MPQLTFISVCTFPTLGLETEFLDELSKLSNTVEELAIAHPDNPLYLPGDFNVSQSNKRRSDLLNLFCTEQLFLHIFRSQPQTWKKFAYSTLEFSIIPAKYTTKINNLGI